MADDIPSATLSAMNAPAVAHTPTTPSAPAADPAAATPGTPATPVDAGSTTAPAFNFTEFVPQEYREKQWVKDIERSGDQAKDNLFKLIENQQSMLGKKTNGFEIPTEESTDEVKQAYRKAMGVPDKADDYQYTPIDVSAEPEEIQNLVKTLSEDQTTVNRMRTKAHELGIRPQDFQALASEFDQLRLEELKGAHALAAQNQQAFVEKQNATFTNLYGANADNVKNVAHEMARKLIPEDVRATGDDSIALYAVLNLVHEKFYKDDVIITPNAAASTGNLNKAELHEAILKERQKPDYKDPWHPNYKEHHKKVDVMYDRYVTMQ